METFTKFFYDILSQFFSGIAKAIIDLAVGFKNAFDIPAYVRIINQYKESLSVSEWVLAVISIALLVIIVGMFVALIILIVRKNSKIGYKKMTKAQMSNEIAMLNNKVVDLMKKNNEIMSMKVSQLGLKPD